MLTNLSSPNFSSPPSVAIPPHLSYIFLLKKEHHFSNIKQSKSHSYISSSLITSSFLQHYSISFLITTYIHYFYTILPQSHHVYYFSQKTQILIRTLILKNQDYEKLNQI
jgi:hypothetical protein